MRRLSFNRTIVELKLCRAVYETCVVFPFNRTIVELKLLLLRHAATYI